MAVDARVTDDHPAIARSVAKFENCYEPVPECGCWLWTELLTTNGYGRFYMDGSVVRAHRAAWLLFRGSIPNGMFVCHHCDVPCCVNPNHLFIGTPRDNYIDMVKKGRLVVTPMVGQANGRAKLSPEQVMEIRLSTESQRLSAARYGVTKTLIRKIRKRQLWTAEFPARAVAALMKGAEGE